MSELLGKTLRDRQALLQLADSEGWKVIEGDYKRRLAELTDAALDPKTPNNEAEILRHVRAKLIADFSPHAIHSTLLHKLDLVAERERSRQPKPEPDRLP